MVCGAAFIVKAGGRSLVSLSTADVVPMARIFLYLWSRRLSIFKRFNCASVLRMYFSTLYTVSCMFLCAPPSGSGITASMSLSLVSFISEIFSY